MDFLQSISEVKLKMKYSKTKPLKQISFTKQFCENGLYTNINNSLKEILQFFHF